MKPPPWRRPRHRFAFVLGGRPITPGQQSIGWAVYALEPPAVLEEGEWAIARGDQVAEIVRMARAAGRETVTLYRYASAAAFEGSRAHGEGMRWADHNRMIAATAAALRAADLGVEVEVVA